MIKKQNIQGETWDNLIILDACRFDFFEKIYKEYMDGELEKRISKGSNTGEWLAKTFPDKYDYTYISANPYINSYGVSLNRCRPEYRNYSWNAVEHFSNIIDVWEFGWKEEVGTIHPKEVNKAYLSNKDNNKTIIHYVQPHYPYLSYGGVFGIRNKVNILKDEPINYKQKLKKNKLVEPIKKLPRLKKIQVEIGLDKLFYYYEDNLRTVLKHVSHLTAYLNGTTIITADHGEAFGEEGVWEHPIETHIPVLIEVPWLAIHSKRVDR